MKLRQWILIGCGWGIVFGLLNGLSNIYLLPSAPFISLRPQIVLPMVVGLLTHPISGFLAGFLGNWIGDGLSGFGLWTFWNWHLANGLMGFIPGLIRYLGVGRIQTVREFGILEFAVVLASAVSVAVAVLADGLFLGFMKFPGSFHSWILPAFLTDAVHGFVLVPLILIAFRRIVITLEVKAILLITLLLVTAILATAGAIISSVWDDLVSPSAMVENFYLSGIVAVLLLILGFVAALIFVRRITDPLGRIGDAAVAVEQGRYDLGMLAEIVPRADELGQLARVLRDMAEQIHERELRLQKQVYDLQVRIDRGRQAEQVAEIVDTEYFQDLKKKAKEIRASRGGKLWS